MKKLLLFVCSFVVLSAFAGEVIEPKEKLSLFNGEDLAGWKVHLRDSDKESDCFKAEDGALVCAGKPIGYIRTAKDYKNYKLHVEWRWVVPEEGKKGRRNSGVLLHMSKPDRVWPKSIECQLMSGNAGDFFVIGGTDMKEHTGKGRRVPKDGKSSEKPLGEWNEYEIVCAGNTITPYVNGVEKNEATGTSVESGKICLQSEGAPIEFRNIYLEPLDH